jgi:hypothetical protein
LVHRLNSLFLFIHSSTVEPIYLSKLLKDYRNYLSVVEAIMDSVQEISNGIISPKYFQLNCMENGNKDSSPVLILKVKKNQQSFLFTYFRSNHFCQNIIIISHGPVPLIVTLITFQNYVFKIWKEVRIYTVSIY